MSPLSAWMDRNGLVKPAGGFCTASLDSATGLHVLELLGFKGKPLALTAGILHRNTPFSAVISKDLPGRLVGGNGVVVVVVVGWASWVDLLRWWALSGCERERQREREREREPKKPSRRDPSAAFGNHALSKK